MKKNKKKKDCKILKNIFYYFINSILAGVMIGIGGTVFLSLDNKIIGSIFLL